MQLDGIHHITAITGDGPRNVDFYARVLGLRLVKKSVNQDDPTAYHLFYADEDGSHGADLTFFEYPGVGRGRPGAGMISRIVHRVGSEAALDYWAERLGGEGIATERADGALRFEDPEGLAHALAVVETTDAPLVARHREVPVELALRGFEAVHALVADPSHSELMVEKVLGFRPEGGTRSRPAARIAAAASSSSRPTGPASRGPARCTTSPGRRAGPTSRTGGRGSCRSGGGRAR